MTITVPIRTAKRLPKESGRYLVFINKEWCIADFGSDAFSIPHPDPDGDEYPEVWFTINPTHWCELPPNPNEPRASRRTEANKHQRGTKARD